MKLLEEAVAELKGEKVEEEIERRSTSMRHLYPEDLRADENLRMMFYKKIAQRATTARSELRNEMQDRFGTLPGNVEGLLESSASSNSPGRLASSRLHEMLRRLPSSFIPTPGSIRTACWKSSRSIQRRNSLRQVYSLSRCRVRAAPSLRSWKNCWQVRRWRPDEKHHENHLPSVVCVRLRLGTRDFRPVSTCRCTGSPDATGG